MRKSRSGYTSEVTSERKCSYTLVYDPTLPDDGPLTVGMSLSSDAVFRKNANKKVVWEAFLPGTKFRKQKELFEVVVTDIGLQLLNIQTGRIVGSNTKRSRANGDKTRKAIVDFLKPLSPGKMPTLRAIGDAVGIKSETSVNKQIRKLELTGHLKVVQLQRGKYYDKKFWVLKEYE